MTTTVKCPRCGQESPDPLVTAVDGRRVCVDCAYEIAADQ